MTIEDKIRDAFAEMSSSVPPPSMEPGFIVRSARTRVLRNMIAALLAITAVAIGVVALAKVSLHKAPPVSGPSPSASHPPDILQASSLSKDGTLRCSVQVPPDERAGSRTRAVVALENISKHSIEYQDVYASIWIAHADGTKQSPDESTGFLSDQVARVPSPRLVPNQRIQLDVRGFGDPQLRWSGEVRLGANCYVDTVELPEVTGVQFYVAPPGPTPDSSAALKRAIAARPGLLDNCEPGADGKWVRGELTPPSKRDLPAGAPIVFPPIKARCSAIITVTDGVDLVELRILAPPDAEGFDFSTQPDNWITSGHGTPPIGILRWYEVVTPDGVFDDNDTNAGSITAGKIATHTSRLFWDATQKSWVLGGSVECGGLGTNEFMWFSSCLG